MLNYTVLYYSVKCYCTHCHLNLIFLWNHFMETDKSILIRTLRTVQYFNSIIIVDLRIPTQGLNLRTLSMNPRHLPLFYHTSKTRLGFPNSSVCYDDV